VDEAIAELRKTTEINPLDPFAWNWLANAYSAAGQFKLARRSATRSLEISPELDELANHLAALAIVEGRPADTLVIVERLKSTDEATRLSLLQDESAAELKLNPDDRRSFVTRRASPNTRIASQRLGKERLTPREARARRHSTSCVPSCTRSLSKRSRQEMARCESDQQHPDTQGRAARLRDDVPR